ncbi:MAG: hypothetical protein C0621_06300 [Desulfuromonas sp.]|nr:MAG: hypothetical protein C0621_06300 [Desulfuromonas sp.]
MRFDRFDRIIGLALAVTAIALTALLWRGAGDDARSGRSNPQLEKRLAQQAKSALLQKIYGPVEQLREKGALPEALLKLDEIARQMPGEAHGVMLRGEIQYQLGALNEAITSLSAGVRSEPLYIDAGSPLSRRNLIEEVVRLGMKQVAPQAKSAPENRRLNQALTNLYYLQSRLAGGCE